MSTSALSSRTARDIILRPIISEKSISQTVYNKYTFRVLTDSNKCEIRGAIEEIFKVKVVSVHTVNVKGKPVRRGRYHGHRQDWKKAIITLKPGEKIEIAGVSYFES